MAHKQTTSMHHPATVRPSPLFFKYLKDVKTGNIKIDPSPDVSNRTEELGVTSLVTSLVDTALTSDLVQSRVITSPFTSYQSRRPPQPFFLSSPPSLSSAKNVLQEVRLPAWPQHYSRVFECFIRRNLTKKVVFFRNQQIFYIYGILAKN